LIHYELVQEFEGQRHDPNGEIYFVNFSRDLVTLTSPQGGRELLVCEIPGRCPAEVGRQLGVCHEMVRGCRQSGAGLKSSVEQYEQTGRGGILRPSPFLWFFISKSIAGFHCTIDPWFLISNRSAIFRSQSHP